MPSFIDLTSKKYNRLLVLQRYEKEGKKVYWLCKCDCGNEFIARGDNLKNGEIQSCGCLHRDVMRNIKTSHNQSRTKLHYVWNTILQRCENPNDKKAKDYLGRGITVCPEWHDYIKFAQWAKDNGYKEGLSIERINNDKGYSPENCKWATAIEQANNMRSNRRIEYNGETKTLAQWARLYNINYFTLRNRLERGWSFEHAITAGVAA